MEFSPQDNIYVRQINIDILKYMVSFFSSQSLKYEDCFVFLDGKTHKGIFKGYIGVNTIIFCLRT